MYFYASIENIASSIPSTNVLTTTWRGLRPKDVKLLIPNIIGRIVIDVSRLALQSDMQYRVFLPPFSESKVISVLFFISSRLCSHEFMF